MLRRLLLALVVLALMVPAASAHERVVLDPDDSEGPLDIVAARLTHPTTSMKLLLVTFEAWNDSTLSGELNYVRFDFDRRGEPGIERCLVVHLDPPEPPAQGQAEVYRDCDAPLPYHHRIATGAAVTRPDLHSIEVTFDRMILWKRPLRNLRWRAHTSYESSDHPSCQPPDPLPPEHFFGTCSDATRWKRH